MEQHDSDDRVNEQSNPSARADRSVERPSDLAKPISPVRRVAPDSPADLDAKGRRSSASPRQFDDVVGAPPERSPRELLLEELFKQSPAAMFVCDIAGRVVRCNQRFLELLGYEDADLLSQHIGTIMHPDDAARDFALRDDLLAGRNQRPQVQTRYKRKDASWCSVDAEFSVMRGDASSALFTIGTLRKV